MVIKKFLSSRIYRFRLITLFGLVTLLATVMLMSHYLIIQPYRRQSLAAQCLADRGATLRFERSSVTWPLYVIMPGTAHDVVSVEWKGCKVHDEQLPLLCALPRLRQLELDNNPITDAGMKHIVELTHLEQLSLHNTEITDSGITRLLKLHHLKVLDIRDTRTSDTGLATLARLPKLQELSFGVWRTNTRLPTEVLERLPYLQVVEWQGSTFSADEFRRLREMQTLNELSVVAFDIDSDIRTLLDEAGGSYYYQNRTSIHDLRTRPHVAYWRRTSRPIGRWYYRETEQEYRETETETESTSRYGLGAFSHQ